MRIAFVKTLFEIAQNDPRIILLSADLGYSVFEEYMEKLPKQYINVGISEQNMTGMAAGMAMEGRVPVIYSIVPFVTMRNFEQIRNDICYQNVNVKIVGVGAGFSYGPYGHTHHGVEDIGILRTLSNLVILTPGDPVEVEQSTRAAFQHNGPVYIRLGKAGEPIVHAKKPKFKIGKGIVLSDGRDITLFATSTLLFRGAEVKTELEKKGMSVTLVSIPTIKPIDSEIILQYSKKTRALFTLEEHSVIGGLGSAVAEVLAENGFSKKFKRIGVPDRFTKKMGLQEFMRNENGLSTKKIVATILKEIN